MIQDPQHSLTLGGLPLVSDGKAVQHTAGFKTEVSPDGTTWGNPEQVVVSLLSALADGDPQAVVRYGNRQPVLHVRITETATGGLHAGEKALMAVVGKPVELQWQPPLATDPLTVFDVVGSRMEFAFNDVYELLRQRSYMVTMAALPWARSAGKVITAAVTAVAPTVVDSGSATTNWTATSPAGAVVSVVSGAVTSTYNPSVASGGFYGTTVVRAFPVALNTATAKFLAVDWKSSLTSLHAARTSANSSVNMTEVRREPAAAGYTRSWYRVADSTASISSLTFGIIHPSNPAASATLSIDQVLQANALPASGTTRQKISTVFPGGSVPAEGDVLVQHATAGLGQAVVYSHKAGSGYSPPLRQWRVSGPTVTADASLVSGARNAIGPTGDIYRMPVSAVPDGDVHFWARLRATAATGAKQFSWSASSWMNGTILDYDLRLFTYNFATLDTWYLVPIGRLSLPSTRVGPAGYVEIRLQEGTVTHGIEVDEAWLFAMDEGRLTVLDCGTGTGVSGGIANRLKVTAPSLERPFGEIVVANAADFSDAYTPGANTIQCDQVGHRFDPEGAAVLTVTSGTLDASVSFEHYPRWHSNAGS